MFNPWFTFEICAGLYKRRTTRAHTGTLCIGTVEEGGKQVKSSWSSACQGKHWVGLRFREHTLLQFAQGDSVSLQHSVQRKVIEKSYWASLSSHS